MKLRTEYNRLEKQANKYYSKHHSFCSDMFLLIEPLINISDDSAVVFNQAGDGYVLSWDSQRGSTNTPVDKIIEYFIKHNEILGEEELSSISI